MNIGFPELLIILLILLLIFGAGRFVTIAKSLGTSIREFKKASQDDSKGKEDEEKKVG